MIKRKFYDILIIICIILILVIYWRYVQIRTKRDIDLIQTTIEEVFKQGFDKEIVENNIIKRENENNTLKELLFCKNSLNESVLKENSSIN